MTRLHDALVEPKASASDGTFDADRNDYERRKHAFSFDDVRIGNVWGMFRDRANSFGKTDTSIWKASLSAYRIAAQIDQQLIGANG